ncbi:MAG: flagellar hook-associated protein FlgK [Alphaproteobacteria bacterium]
MSLTLGLGAALSGLLTSQKGLDLVSHNIANVNTEGYTRKQFNPESRVLDGHGVGVQVSQATREVDNGLLRDVRRETGIQQKMQSISDYYARMQDLFGEPENASSISHIISTAQSEIENMAVSPSSATVQANAVDSVVRVTQKLNSMAEQIQELRRQADRSIEDNVASLNDTLTNIANLNEKIVRDLATGTGAADLEDKRDLALKKLSEQIDIQVFSRPNGAIVVFTTSGTSLVDSSSVSVTHASITSVSPWQNNGSSDFQSIGVGPVDITSEVRQGKLKGLIDLRDTILPNLQSELDELTSTMRDEINKVNNRGVAYPQMTTTMTGSRKFIQDADENRTVATDLYAAQGYTQTLTMSGGDVAIGLFNSQGAQSATTTLSTIMNTDYSAAGPDHNLVAQGGTGAAWTIDQVAGHLQSWLNANGAATATVAVNTTGKLAITLNSTSLSLGFRDQASSTAGATAGDVSIAFNADGPQLIGTTTMAAAATFAAADGLRIGTTNISVAGQTLAAAVATINAQAATTGVYASNVNGRLSFSTASTTAITIGNSTAGGATSALGTAGITVGSTVAADTDLTVSGFSNFFGLNDLITTDRNKWMWDSAVKNSTDTILSAGTLNFQTTNNFVPVGHLTAGGTLTGATVTVAGSTITASSGTPFYKNNDATTPYPPVGSTFTMTGGSTLNAGITYTVTANTGNVLTVSPAPVAEAAVAADISIPALGSISVTATDTLSTIADKINNSATLSISLQASVIPDGGGYRLRIKTTDGSELLVTQSGALPHSMMDTLGLAPSDCGVSNIAAVRNDIIATPQLISRGIVQYSTDLSQYYMSAGDNTTANQLANLFTSSASFTLAGNLSSTTRTFSDYAANILSQNSNEAANVKDSLVYQNGLQQALVMKSAEFSAVNLDEEMSKLMVFQQSYTAAAKVIAATQAMLDVLNNLIR